MSQFKKTTLDNGVRVLTESHADTQCVELGFWVDKGTRDEPDQLHGVAHFLEHLVFKGTEKYTSYELAKSVEALGGEINAFTTKEHTCYHTSTLGEDLEKCVDVLSELYCKSLLRTEEYEREKNVVLQEILMSKDDIEDRVFESYFEKAFKGHSLGRTILGTTKSVSSLKRDDVYSWYKSTYSPTNLIVSASGQVDHARLVTLIKDRLGDLQMEAPEVNRQQLDWEPFAHREESEDGEQTHVLVSFEGAKYADTNRFDAYLLNTLLGGGMTSRLYQKVREENGWAYSVFSMLNTYTDFGSHIIYAATDGENERNVLSAVLDEIELVTKKGIPSDELDYFKKQAVGQIIIASEDIENRMHSLAVNEMVFREYKPVSSVVKEIEAVSDKSLQEYIEKYLHMDRLHSYVYAPVEK